MTASASDPPGRADVVVIGGGVVGASVAYHLATLGCRDVVLLEGAKIGSGTTWHAGGNMETYRPDPVLGEMVAYTVSLFPRLAAESGIDFGWRQPGRVHFTADRDVFAGYRSVPARSRARGVTVEILTPAEIVAKAPVLSADGLVGGLWIPNDGRVEPTNLAMAYARAAARAGARIIEDTRVRSIVTRDGRVAGVATAAGIIATETVVLAAGLWSTALAATCGVRLPLIGLHHFYIQTKPIAGVPPDLPLYLSYDERIWGREEVGGLIIGVFDSHAIPIEPDELPATFVFSLLPENWAQIAPHMPILMRRFPALEKAEIRALVNGPESFTPDGEMLLGEAPGMRGLHLATGMNSNGIALAAGAGRATAERLIHGRSSFDVTQLSIRRFQPFQGGRDYRRARMGEIFEVGLRPPGPARDYTRTRDIRRGPAHDVWAQRGAVFAAVAGFEQAQWFGDPLAWPDAVTAELAAARHGAAVADRSADAKLWLEGPGAAALLARLSGRVLPAPVGVVPLPDGHGGLAALPLVVTLDATRFLLLADPMDGVRLEDTLRRAIGPDDGTVVVDVGAGWAAFVLHGPEAGAILGDPPPPGRWAAVDVGFAPAMVMTLPGSDARLVLATADFGAAVAMHLASVARPIGALAAESWRVLEGVARWGHEVGPGLLVDAHRRLLRGSVATDRPGSLAQEPILAAGRTVGYVTSSTHVPVDGRIALFALVDEHAKDLTVLIDGEAKEIAASAVIPCN